MGPKSEDEVSTKDPYLKDLKSDAHMKLFWAGKPPYSGRSYNDWCKILMQKRHVALLSEKADAWLAALDDPELTNYLPTGNKEFYREEFIKYDANLDGLL